MKKQTIKLNEENINSEHWNNKIDMLLRTLQYLKDHLENGLFVVDGFVGGQRMEAINRIGLCCMALNDILNKGGITLTDKSVPVESPYKLNESQLRNIIKESIKKVLKESVIKSMEFLDKNENVCYGEDEMSFFAANYLRNEFRRFPDIAQAKACAQEMLQREKRQRAEEMSGLRY